MKRMTLDDIGAAHADLEADPTRFLAFHGTVAEIGEEGLRPAPGGGHGGHGNCSLAVHVSCDIHVAKDYAQQRQMVTGKPGLIYAVEVTVSGLIALSGDREDYIEMTAQRLEAIRQEVPGISLIVADELGDDLIDAVMVLNPADTRILGVIPESAVDMEEFPGPWGRLSIMDVVPPIEKDDPFEP